MFYFFFYRTDNISRSEQKEPSKFAFKLLRAFGIINGAVTGTGGGEGNSQHMRGNFQSPLRKQL